MVSSVLKHKKAMIFPMEKTSVLDKLGSGLSYSATGYEFSVDELTIQCVQKKEEKKFLFCI